MEKTSKIINFCMYHGMTEFYKNGHCKECVKYKRLQTLNSNKENFARSTICLQTTKIIK